MEFTELITYSSHEFGLEMRIDILNQWNDLSLLIVAVLLSAILLVFKKYDDPSHPYLDFIEVTRILFYMNCTWPKDFRMAHC